MVCRTHGGARIASQSDEILAFEIRENENVAAKRAIAEAAYQRIRPQSTILLDSGTTVLQLARRIRIDPIPINVFTNGLKVALELVNVAEVQLTLLGGDIRTGNLSSAGPLAEAMLERLWFDQLFLGVGGIGDDVRICSVDGLGARLNALMLTRAAETHVLADAGKFGRRATYVVSPLAAATSIIVDDALPAEWREPAGRGRTSARDRVRGRGRKSGDCGQGPARRTAVGGGPRVSTGGEKNDVQG